MPVEWKFLNKSGRMRRLCNDIREVNHATIRLIWERLLSVSVRGSRLLF